MNPTLRNIFAVLIGVVIGGMVNMGIVNVSGSIIPPPAGADVTTIEGLKASMHLFGPQHFLFPFLAHAVGTFIGALIACFLAVSNEKRIGLGIGIFFLVGGISAVAMLPSPLWFSIVDIAGAYLPMGFLGALLGIRLKK